MKRNFWKVPYLQVHFYSALIHVAQTEICLILWSLYFKECNFTSCFVMRYTILIILFTFTAISNSNGKQTEHKNKMHHKKSKVQAVWPPSSIKWTSNSKKLLYWNNGNRVFCLTFCKYIHYKCKNVEAVCHLPLGN